MAVDLSGTGQYLTHAAAVVSGPPFTLACWFATDNLTTVQHLVGLSSSNGELHHLSFQGNSAGDPIQAVTVSAAVTGRSPGPATSGVANTWTHAAGVWASSTSRLAYTNGVAGTADTTNLNPTVSRSNIGVNGASGNLLDGRIALVAIWDVALTAAEVAELAAGRLPNALSTGRQPVAYIPLPSNADLTDHVGSFDFTATGSPGSADDPPVGIGAAAGTSTASGALATTFSGAGAASGAAAASAVGGTIAAGAGASSGSGAASATGASVQSGAGSAAGSGTASGSLAVIAAGVGSAAGIAAGDAEAENASAGTVVGPVGLLLLMVSEFPGAETGAEGAGLAEGVATAEAVASPILAIVGAAAGAAAIDGRLDAVASGAASADGVSSAAADGESVAEAVGAAIGAAQADGVFSLIASGAGQAAGTAAAIGAGNSTADFAGGVVVAFATAAAVGAAEAEAQGEGQGAATADAVGTGLWPITGISTAEAFVAGVIVGDLAPPRRFATVRRDGYGAPPVRRTNVQDSRIRRAG